MTFFRTPTYCKATRVLGALLLSTALAGCAGQGAMQQILSAEPAYLQANEERAFAKELRQRYLELATNAYDRQDFRRSDFYGLRSIMALEGKLVQPAEMHDARLTAEQTNAFQRLQSVLARGMRLSAPEATARSQSALDCWISESAADGDATIAQACRGNMLSALDMLEGIGTGSTLVADATPSIAPHIAPYVQQSYVQPASVGSSYEAPLATTSRSYNAEATVQAHDARSVAVMSVPHFEAAPSSQASPPQMQVYKSQAITPSAPMTTAYDAPATLEIGPLPVVPPATVTRAPIVQQEYVPFVPAYQPEQQPERMGGSYQVMAQQPQTPADLAPSPAAYVAQPVVEQYAPVPSPVFVAETAEWRPAHKVGMVDLGAWEPVAIVEGPTNASEMLGLLSSAQAGVENRRSVFFGFDSAEITPEAEDVLNELLESARRAGLDRIRLSGFTDSAGDARYNQLLAMRRTQAVRSFLQERSTRPLRFEMTPVGETLAVRNGGDGVVEALNRKVEVMIQ